MSPDRAAVWLLAAWVGLALLASFVPVVVWMWAGGGVLLLAALLVDLLRVRRHGPFEAERSAPGSIAVGVWTRVRLHLRNRGRTSARLLVWDHPPATMQTQDLPRRLTLRPGHEANFDYRVCPTRRGEMHFEPAELCVHSPWRLWRRQLRAGEPQRARVYPNFREIVKYGFLAIENRTSQLGIRRRPRRGEGSDFHALREYRAGDVLRQIDWKATARLRRTISREYQDERDQLILFLLDCGGRMHSRDDELSHFDHALDAVLLLAYVALRQGDAVGLLTFSGERRWLAPRKGAGHVHPLLNTVFDLQTSTRAPDYVGAAEELIRRVRRRALVVLVSNLREEDQGELDMATRILTRRHLLLLGSLRERVLAETLEQRVDDLDAALRIAATHQYLERRRRVHERLGRRGALLLDAEPAGLAVALVNGYLDIKSRGLL